MITKLDKNKVRKKRHARVRTKIHGTPERPRLNVYFLTKTFTHKSLTMLQDIHLLVLQH